MCRFDLGGFSSAALQGGSRCESPETTLGVNSRCPWTAEHGLRIVNGRSENDKVLGATTLFVRHVLPSASLHRDGKCRQSG